jgi:hypothetical protein
MSGSMPTASLLDAAAGGGDALLKMAYASVLASVAVAVVFSLAVLGVIRAGEMRRADRPNAAVAYAALALAGLAASAGCVIFGLVLMAQKS